MRSHTLAIGPLPLTIDSQHLIVGPGKDCCFLHKNWEIPRPGKFTMQHGWIFEPISFQDLKIHSAPTMAAYETLLLCLGAAVIFFVLPTVFLRSLGGKGAPIRQRIVPVKHKIADRFRIDVPDRPGLELSADWTHEKLFQLERRAFFSKVCIPIVFLHRFYMQCH